MKMWNSLGTIIFIFLNGILYCQQIQIGPITGFQELNSIKSNNNIDSSFIYSTDTLNLPIFDDFSSNKFQNYLPDFNDPDLNSEIFYHLTDPVTLMPVLTEIGFTNQPTFKRVYDLATGSFNDSIFTPITIRVGDLNSYPVNYEGINLFPPYYLIDTINDVDVNIIDTIWLNSPEYIQDSAIVFYQTVNDPTKIWIDKSAYHNYRYGLNPFSLGVVTFDGLNEKGNPYQFGSTNSDYADELTSKPIKLGNFSPGDSVYLTFLYQPEGLGDIPESSDSLLVEFYAPEEDTWNRVWSVSGTPVHEFRAVALKVASDEYLQDGFRFRFRNYGSLAGSLDHFHVDYVHLRNLSNSADTLNKDFAFSYPLNSLLKNYTAVPWDHYKTSVENKMSDSVLIRLFNGSDIPENYQDGLIEIYFNDVIESSFNIPGFDLAESNINYQPRTLHTSFHNLTSGYEFDRTKSGPKQMFKVKTSAVAQFPNFSDNDSTVFEQEFYNYYSYDDGSAEAAFGPTGVQAKFAVEFNAYQPDSLIGISICFVPSVNDVSDKQFLLSVWSDNNGNPGSLLYEDDVFNPRNPVYGYGKNEFKNYYFLDTMRVFVGTKYHIGWRQFESDRLNLGLDRNIDNSSKIKYSIDGGNNWLTSPFPGSAMIRPIYSTELDNQLDNNESEPTKFELFPNPVKTILNIGYERDLESILLNLNGQILNSYSKNQIDLTNLQNGIYFLYIKELNILKKIIKI